MLLIEMAIGMVLSATVVLTAPLTVYQIAKDPVGSDHQWELGVHSTYFTYSDPAAYTQFGTFTGLQVVTRIIRNRLGMGVVGETGYLNYRLTNREETASTRDQTFYFLAGPEARFYFKDRPTRGFSLYLQILAGTASVSDIGFMGVQRLGLTIPLGRRYSINIPEVGWQVAHLRGYESALTKTDTGAFEFGFGASFQF